jgi:glutaconate CoA-transferase, subunit B
MSSTPLQSSTELMISAASKEIENGNVVFVGIGLPVLACLLAQRTRAPDISMIFESGVIGAKPSRMVLTMGDPAIATGSAMVVDFFDLFALMLQRGLVDVAFLGAAQIDRHGNLNTSVVGDYVAPKVRLPGSGGACEAASLAKRTIVIMRHEKRRFVEHVDFITSPGHLKGEVSRGIRGGGPNAVITTLGVLRFDNEGEMYLESCHPGVSTETVLQNTGWPLKISKSLKQTPPPTEDEIETLRQIDPKGIFLRRQVE